MMDNVNIQKINDYTIQLVADQVYAIDEFGVALCYLVIGEEKAALIDTANGFGRLYDTVHTLTDKEIIVLNTHGHSDHIGGNGAFDQTYMSLKDDFLRETSFTSEKWKKSCEKTAKEPGFVGQQYLDPKKPPKLSKARNLKAGDCFDLGNRCLEVIETPGHTPGSVVFLDRENRLLFAGDSIVSTPILIFDTYSSNVKSYLYGLKDLLREEQAFDLIFPGHYLKPLGKRYLYDLIACAEEIIDGDAATEPIDFSHMSSEKAVLHRHGLASIAYNEKHIL